jgi:hypothetical protein
VCRVGRSGAATDQWRQGLQKKICKERRKKESGSRKEQLKQKQQAVSRRRKRARDRWSSISEAGLRRVGERNEGNVLTTFYFQVLTATPETSDADWVRCFGAAAAAVAGVLVDARPVWERGARDLAGATAEVVGVADEFHALSETEGRSALN